MGVVLTPHSDGIYASFPTFVTYKGKVHLFYREGRRSVYQVHGLFGKVKKIVFPEKELLSLLEGKAGKVHCEERVIFAEENELDAIVSKLGDNLFCLCTRVSVVGVRNTCYVSFSNTPEFMERKEVKISGVELDAFYGKAFKSEYGYVFTAYGHLGVDGLQRPLLLITDGTYWDVLSFLPTKINGNRLNETSVVFYKGMWHAFVREDDPPYGIWHFVSDDLISWHEGKKLFSRAHAPMAFSKGDELILCFRLIVSENRFAVAYTYPLEDDEIHVIEYYSGDCFDGGYCDIGIISENLVVFYYHDSGTCSPVIKGALPKCVTRVTPSLSC